MTETPLEMATRLKADPTSGRYYPQAMVDLLRPASNNLGDYMNKVARTIFALILAGLMLIACPMPEAPPSNWPADWSSISEAERQSYFRRLTPAVLDGFVAGGWNVKAKVIDTGDNSLGINVLPIHLAARYGASAEVIGWLVAEGRNDVNAYLNHQNEFNPSYTPIHFAVLSNNFETVDALIKAGARTTNISRRGDTAFTLAVMKASDLRILRAVTYSPLVVSAGNFVFGGQKNLGQCNARTPLEYAVSNAALFKVLVELAEDSINTFRPDCNNNKWTWLHLILIDPTTRNSAEIFDALLASPHLDVNKRIGPNSPLQTGWTPLHIAVDSARHTGPRQQLTITRTQRLLAHPRIDAGLTADTRVSQMAGSPMIETPFQMATRLKADPTSGRYYPQAMVDLLRPPSN